MNRVFIKVLTAVLIMSFVQFSLYSEIGFKLGFQRTDFEGKSAFDLSSYKVGLFYSVKIGKNLALQPEVYFSHFGTRIHQPDYGDILTIGISGYDSFVAIPNYRQKLSYIELPVLLKYRIPLKGDLTLPLLAGGYFAYRVSKNLNDGLVQHPYVTYIPYSKTDSGLVMGIGLEHMGSKTDIHFDLRVNIGVPNVNENASHGKKRNHSLAFMVGVGF